MELSAFGDTDVGRVRDHNEDRCLMKPEMGLYAVADGAGGHNAGEVAAALAVRSLGNFFGATEKEYGTRPDYDRFGIANGERRMVRAIQKANADIVEVSKESQQYRGMGTTIVAAQYNRRPRLLHVGHVGDSRCYRLRGEHLEQLTVDHTLLTDIVEEYPHLDDSALERLPKHVVTRALGMAPTVRVSVRSYPVAPGDRYLLCSDGLTGPVDDKRLREVMGRDADPDDLVRTLIDDANHEGGPDNVAALVIFAEASGVPAMASVRAPPMVPEGDPNSSFPEILILGVEDIDLREAVVPRQPGTDSLLETLQELLGKR